MPTRSVRKIVQETTPLIIFFAIIELGAGGTLGWMTEQMALLPGILVIIPPLLAMRGNISAAFGARLSSGLHLGFIRPNKVTADLKTNVWAALILNLFLSVVLALFAWIAFLLIGLPAMSPLALFSICIIVGVGSGTILAVMAIFIAFISYRRGLDPDNITTPSIASLGDIITVICRIINSCI